MNTNRIKVEKIVNGGYGLGRLNNGQVVLLHNSLDGETVHYKILEKRKNIIFGTAESFLVKNNARIDPPCPYYHKCGGCNLQHCSYEKQLQIKNSITEELLLEISNSTPLLHTIVPSPQHFGYRQRIRLKTGADTMGFLKFRSSEIVAIEACLLAHPIINQVLGEIQQNLEFLQLRTCTEEIELLFNPKNSLVSCLFHFTRKPRPADRNTAVKLVNEIKNLERIFFCGASFSLEGPFGIISDDGNSKMFSQQIDCTAASTHFELTWEVGGFCQVNLMQNSNLIDYVLLKCGDVADKTILDLFCGMGNFSIPLAHSASSLYGIEGQGSAIRSARKNSILAELSNTVFRKGPIHETCNTLTEQNQKFDIVVLDPPRQGVPGLAPQLSTLTGEKIIYISCDQATLRRDLVDLCNHGFCLIEIQPFDMFPQTHHIETVAVLEKN